MLMTSFCREYKLVLLIEVLLPQDFSALFMAGLSCLIHYDFFTGVGTVVLLTRLPSDSKSSLYDS